MDAVVQVNENILVYHHLLFSGVKNAMRPGIHGTGHGCRIIQKECITS